MNGEEIIAPRLRIAENDVKRVSHALIAECDTKTIQSFTASDAAYQLPLDVRKKIAARLECDREDGEDCMSKLTYNLRRRLQCLKENVTIIMTKTAGNKTHLYYLHNNNNNNNNNNNKIKYFTQNRNSLHGQRDRSGCL